MEESRDIGKYISMLQRMNSMYFAGELASYQIGCGQQFFLLHISKNPGITFQELAAFGYYDKGTATRAVQKLEEEGYVRLETDSLDKRIRHIFATEKADEVIVRTKEIVTEQAQILLDGFTEEERDVIEKGLQRMTENAKNYLSQSKNRSTQIL